MARVENVAGSAIGERAASQIAQLQRTLESSEVFRHLLRYLLR